MRNTYVEIDLGQIKKNTLAIQEVCGKTVGICAVIKADAYGHGMIHVAKELENEVAYFAVAIINEGKILRDAGITKPILVLAAVDNDEIDEALTYGLTLTVASKNKLEKIIERGKQLSVVPVIHLKIDTGMGRIGVQYDRAGEFIDMALAAHNDNAVVCEGIFSHFSDSVDEAFTRIQADRFIAVLDMAKVKGFSFTYVHMCSSRSIFLYPEYRFSMVRPGIALYGIEPEPKIPLFPSNMLPALSFKTKVVFFKVLEKGDPLGYARAYVIADEYERIITLPVGYADGLPRRLSNNGHVLVHGKKYPIVGRVCMDQIMVSLGKEGEAYLDDEVTLIGADGSERITAEDISLQIETTPHEITTCISLRVPRIYK